LSPTRVPSANRLVMSMVWPFLQKGQSSRPDGRGDPNRIADTQAGPQALRARVAG